jgi:hypothetical protein
MITRKILTGDTGKAARYLPLAQNYLKQAERIKVRTLTRNLPNGVSITVMITRYEKIIKIHAQGGMLWVADSSNSRIKQVATIPLGGKAKVYSEYGTGEGQFDGLAFDIAAMGQKIYATNTSLGAVDIYSLTGEFQLRVIVANHPVYHIAAADGLIAVVANVGGSNPSNDTVLVYDTDFNLVTSFTQIADYAIGAVALFKNRLYVSVGAWDSGPDINVYDLDSQDLLWSYSGVSLCEGMAVYRGELYVTDPDGGATPSGNYIHVFPTEGGALTRSFGTQGPSNGDPAGVGEFEYYGGGARGIAVDGTGVYVSDVNSGAPAEEFRFRDSITRFTHAGSPISKHVGYGDSLTQYNQPFGLAIKE